MSEPGAPSAPLKKACVACGQEFDASVSVCPSDGTVLTPLVSGVHENILGRVFADKYEILEQIGSGGMGKVYKARHVLMKRLVAIKVLLRELVSESTTLQRFQQEAEAASSLNHPHILTIFDFGISAEALPYIVMDYLEGKSLTAIMQEKDYVPEERAIGIFVQVCAGLAHAHSKGIIHRDLKPSNIMLITFDNQPDFVKIVDFGIAKLTAQSDTEARNLTRTGQVFGSPLYMSPEQCRGGVLDARSDIYSMGCLMYRVVTGLHPIQGESLIDCLNKHCNTTPASFTEVKPELNISSDLETIIFKAMAKEPDDRYQSMKELREALLQIFPAALSWTFTGAAKQAQTVLVPKTKAGEPSAEKIVPEEKGAVTADTSGSLKGTLSTGGATTGNTATPEQPTHHTNLPVPITQAQGEMTNPSLAPTGSTINYTIAAQPRKMVHMLPIAALVVSVVSLALAFMMYFKSKQQQPTATVTTKGDRIELYDQYIKNAEEQLDKGIYFEAQNNIQSALKESRKLGEDDPRTIAALNVLGKIHYAKEDYDSARQTFEHILSMIDPNKQGNTAAVADALNGLGLVYSAQGKYQDATALLNRSKKIRVAVSGADSVDVSDTLLAIAELDMRRGKYKESIVQLRPALQIRENALGKNHPEVAVVLSDLGQCYQLQQKFTEAGKFYDRAITIRENALGRDNPSTADCLMLLGTLDYQKGRLNDSEELLERALSIKEKTLGTDSNALPQILRSLMIVYAARKDYDHAESAIKRALAINEKNLEPSDPELAKTRKYYADLLNQMGRKKEAKALLAH